MPKEQLESRQSRARLADGRRRILPKEQLESRQSGAPSPKACHSILPKEQLESRQSCSQTKRFGTKILPKEQLESRQSSNASAEYIPRNFAERTIGITERTIGIKAKQGTPASSRRFYFAERTIGIKAKQDDVIIVDEAHFAERTIGIKAKHDGGEIVGVEHFAERTIGIKAKRRRRLSRSSRANTDTFNIFAKQNAKFCVVSCFQNTDTFNCRVSHTMLFPLAAPFLKAQKKSSCTNSAGAFFAFRGTKCSENSDVLSGGDARTCSGTCRRGLPCRRSAFPPCTPGASPP